VLAYADVSRSTRAAQRALAQVEQRLAELSENAPPDGAAASPRQSAATPASDVPELSRWQ
jgi:hypothetical protein